MKKIISLVLALALVFSLAACTKTIMGPEKTNEGDQTSQSDATTDQTQISPESSSAYEVVLNAINKMTNLSSFSAVTSSNVSVEYLNVNEKTTVETKINAQGVNTPSLRFSAFSEYTEASEKINTNVYFENNDYYVDTYGIKIKIPASRGGDAYDYFGEIDKYFRPLSKSCYESVPVTDLNGGRSVIVDVSAEDCENDLADIIKETVSSFEESGLGEVKFAGASVRATTNSQGYIDVYSVSLRFDWDVQIGTMHANSEIYLEWSIDFDKYGGVSAVAPEGYASYEEVAADEMASFLLSERVEQMQSLDDIHADCYVKAEMQVGTNKAAFTIADVVRAKNLSFTPSVSHNMQIMLDNNKQTYDIYYENGYYYYRDNNSSFKFSESVAKNDYKSISPTFDIVKALSAKAMKDAAVTVLGGEINIIAMPEAEDFVKEFSVLVNELNYDIMGAPVSEYKIYAPCVTVTIDVNGFIKSYTVIYAVEIPLENDTAVYTSIEASVEFQNPGEDVEIAFPDGYWSFQELNVDILS